MSGFGRLGWFLGLVFGTVFGVLFAPRKGKDLRQKMKADRKAGRLGIAPLHDDIKALGLELAEIAKDIYYSEQVSGIVEKGREKVKDISQDLVSEITDFHKTRIMRTGENAVGGVKSTVKKARKGRQKTKPVLKKAKKSAVNNNKLK